MAVSKQADSCADKVPGPQDAPQQVESLRANWTWRPTPMLPRAVWGPQGQPPPEFSLRQALEEEEDWREMRKTGSRTPIQLGFPEYGSYFTPAPQVGHSELPLTHLCLFTYCLCVCVFGGGGDGLRCSDQGRLPGLGRAISDEVRLLG